MNDVLVDTDSVDERRPDNFTIELIHKNLWFGQHWGSRAYGSWVNWAIDYLGYDLEKVMEYQAKGWMWYMAVLKDACDKYYAEEVLL